MADFLLELFSEEIPARMQAAAARQLHDSFAALLAEAGLSAGSIETFVTPRRLALIAQGLDEASGTVSEERRGPRADAPPAAIDGFLRSTGLTRAELEERDTGKGVFLFANLSREGRPSAEILAEKIPQLLSSFDWPKSQRWGAASTSTASPRWVRPLRAIVALLGADVVEFEALGLRSGRTTFGHRLMGGRDPMAIDRPGSYRNQLNAAFVLLSAEDRRVRIHDSAVAAAEKAGLVLREDPALEAENAGLTEWPLPLLGRFDPAYLDVPNEIIQLTMATNQKYFAVEDRNGQLAPAFVCVANLEAPDKGQAIIVGNERVLSSRLADARFFWEQDKAVKLDDFAARLQGILFHEQLGTLADKVGRVERLARYLADGYFPAVDAELAARAARLMKADLVCGTVGEFPELQGVIGGYLAEAQGEDPALASALRQQYLPCPKGDLAVVVALADRLDSLVSFFGVGIRPTGSRDPFALRRAALGILEMLVSGGRRIALRSVLAFAGAADTDELLAFLADRLKVQQREAGVRHDLIDAVLALGNEDDPVRLLARVQALQAFLATDDGGNLLIGYRRAANILKAEEKRDGQGYAFDADALAAAGTEPAEQALGQAFANLAPSVSARAEAEDFAGAMRLLSEFRAPVDRFFNEVTVNDVDPAKRIRRLGLLAGLRDAMHRIADFSRIEG